MTSPDRATLSLRTTRRDRASVLKLHLPSHLTRGLVSPNSSILQQSLLILQNLSSKDKFCLQIGVGDRL
jgi:hypothetical protein